MGGDEVCKGVDQRIKWVLQRVFTILGYPKAKLEKFMQAVVADEQVMRSIEKFINNHEVAYCFFFQTSGDTITANSAEVPTAAQLKKKVICMHRATQEAEITAENIHDATIFFEFPKNMLETMDKVCRSVYLSMLSNPANQKGWSDLISKDLMDKYHVFLANLHVTVGLRRGETMLPLPPKEAVGSGSEEKDRVHVLEGAIITWTKQIQHVLTQDPEALLKDGRHPEPLVEIDFWKNKAENLNSIHTQLGDDALRRVLQYLEERKSTYTGPFARLQMDVARAREEANDNNRFLKALNVLFNGLTNESAQFEELSNLFGPILHMMLLIWRHSKYYNTPARLVVLIREICNSLIAHAMRYVPGPTIFHMVQGEEASEAVAMLMRTVHIASSFKNNYFVYMELAASDSKSEGWRGISVPAAFSRLDSFLGRVRDTLDFARTVVHYLKLERVDIGGTRGKTLTATVQAIYEEFKLAVTTFQGVEYDIMDVSISNFDDDYYVFKSTVRELDRRLGSVLASSFEDLDTIQGRMKLFDIFEGLIERPIIQEMLEKSYKKLIVQCKADLCEISRSFAENKERVNSAADDAPLYHNMPPIAGAIFWVRSLKRRANEPMAKLLFYNSAVCEPLEEFQDVDKTHNLLVQMLEDYEKAKYEQWEQECVDSAKEKLKMRLLRRHEKTGLLKVNFDPALMRLLREVRYFLLFGLDIPEDAQEMFSRNDTYRGWMGQLDIIVEKYNAVLTELLPVEEPLLEDRIDRMDTVLSPALTELRWRSEEHIPDFITRAMTTVCDVSSVVDVLKGNLRRVSSVLSRWCQQPLLERKPKPMSPEDFEVSHKALVGVKLMTMTEDGKELHKLVKDSSEALKVSKIAPTWKAYVDFVNNIVIEGYVAAIAVSMQYVCELLDPLSIARNENTQPIFDIKVELRGSDVVFDPPFFAPDRSQMTLRSVIDGWLRDFFAMSTMMQRLDTATGDYLNEIREHFQVQCLLSLVSELIDNTEMECRKYRQTFMENAFLWMDSIEDTFKVFLQEGACDLVTDFKSEEGVAFNQIMQMIGVDLGQPIPTMDKFDKQIERFNRLKHELSGMRTPVDIHWLRINAQPVKLALVSFARQWEQKFTGYLHQFTEDRISSIDGFISKVMKQLTGQSPADDKENEKLLYATMTNIRDVKLASTAMRLLFQPINDQCQLLKKHHVVVSEEQLLVLDQAPAKWEEVKRASFEEKEKILDLQKIEMGKIRNKIDKFAEEVKDFRGEFLRECPFGADNAISQDYDASYNILDSYHQKTMDICSHAQEYNNLELLFDMVQSNYRDLKEAQDDLVLLKNLWDIIGLVKDTFLDWNSTLWDKIDTDDLLTRVKEVQTQVKNLPKGMRTWKLYNWLMEEVKNMSTVLPLINDLHSDTMRDRHWTMLMTTTRKSFEKGPEFCFKDLLDLNLHHYAEDVSEIVDQSAKEAKIEKKLLTIRTTWSSMPVQFDCTREDCPLLADLGEIVETLEAHSLEMMGMTSQGRFIEFCQAVVDEWSGKLRTVESVLEVWQKVQSNWCRLEPIFMLSEDIRSQLPEDSKRFEMVDTKWKDLMMEASQSNLIVEICCAEGREGTLKDICEGIDSCEKALNEYLEQKKKAFPRFYFVANQALLDILSNGNKPKKVAAYLGDVFDGVKTLDFSKAPDTGLVASGLVSKDGEKIPWAEDLQLDGAVEGYLTALESHIRFQMRDILEAARGTADNWEVDNPREHWLDHYACQLALVVTQIIWTEETNRVFEELESGSETAMKDYKRVCDDRIDKLIKRVQTELTSEIRVKVITIITIDVHARDVIEAFVQKRLTDMTAFAWQSQLRFHWATCPKGQDLVSFTPEEQKTCVIRICDWVTIYLYEYIGNCGRLVITPLTDRCYITLSQALNLCLGGAPAGPAGTGKTETTKDLSRAIGLPIVVFNCSDQMTYLTMAQIFMGLAQTGSWGCFDEFNRISIEVLSVVSTQYKSVLDAIRERLKSFIFMDEEIRLISTVGAFITMNPGYAGRTELPENLKALFRSCAMIVPDLNFICENMLMSEGFIIARPLSRKFVCLYSLCKELLSKQMHYDWGLRAVKSLLRQAGSLKRKEPDADENPVLCRALRDFNTPKITTNDMPIFLRLIQDLFPGINPEPFKEPTFEKVCVDVVKKRGLQADPGFIVKVVSLLDIIQVRHCCFIIGPSGCSKTECWKSLLDAVRDIGQEGLWEQVNPKAITSDELYGIMTKTKEWRDGAIAVIMRNMSKEMNGFKSQHVHKWVILDGDIDATWIESMNTVMDDNKVLTLVSNERIPFSPTMRMLLEIQDMKHASPATVSRGGVLFINEADVGWKPYIESWRERMDPVAQSAFYLHFSTYFEQNMESIRKAFQFTCPMLDMALVQSITCFVDALLNNNTKDGMEALRSYSAEEQKYVYEAYFVYALMWTIGGIVSDDKITNYRKAFNGWIRSTSKVKYPDQGDALDYRFDATTKEWIHWEQYVVPYEPIAERMYQNIVISTVELERVKYVLDLHVNRAKPVLLIGTAGTSKTTIVKDYLTDVGIKRDDMMSASINHNNYTSSFALQAIMTSYLDKRTGRTYGPPGNRKCIFFIDDLNMPALDTYDTQSAIMLLCQIMSYGSVFDRTRLEERKELTDILFVSCMNPKSGSFMINGRLQRQYTCLTTFAPNAEVISQIYTKILSKHLEGFVPQVQKLVDPLVLCMIDTLMAILNTSCFLPSASKFFYQFNLKDVSNIFQSLLNTSAPQFREGPTKFARVWVHESNRVFGDRLINSSDQGELQAIMEKVTVKHLQGATSINKEDLFAEPLLFTSFASAIGGNDKLYLPIKEMSQLKTQVETKLAEYNEVYAAMNLVLFDMALSHVCRICRITDLPCGNALLVGVGGSGKQSLARLASFINSQDVLSILVNQSYGQAELKVDLQEFYKKTAVKPGTPHAFLMTDGQIADERFLVYINDMLSSGNIPDLFAREEYDAILGNIRNLAKSSGYSDDRDDLFKFFLDRVRKNLHMLLCHSPVGDAFRIRGRKFPALVSCMVIDVFSAWPRDALQGVAQVFLVELQEKGNLPSDDMVTNVSAHTAEVHLSIDGANQRFRESERRHNYTTPKSFLELLSFYIKMLTSKQSKVEANSERLERGLTIMEQVQSKVEGLKEDLKTTMLQVEEKKISTNALIEQVTVASAGAAEEKAAADIEAAKTSEIATNATNIKAQADLELQEAMPAMEAAKDAVDCLKVNAIQELKALPKPPAECVDVCAAVGFLLKGEKKKIDWKSGQKMMNNPGGFLDEIKNFNADEIPEQNLVNVNTIVSLPFFNYETMKSKSGAAAYLCNWVVNIVKYNSIYKKVAPLMVKVKQSTQEKQEAEASLAIVEAQVAEVEARVAQLQATLTKAINDKEAVEIQAAKCLEKLSLAERLVNGLADEYTRWTATVKDLRDLGVRLIGDCLLASAFVGYISPFNAVIRSDLWKTQWINDLNERVIPLSPGIDPLKVLATEGDIAGWQNEGLPADRVSVENAAVVVCCERWPLMIDPQLQGVKWIKQRIGEDLSIVQFTMNQWLSKVVFAIQMGGQLLLEAVGSEIDAILEPLLSRAVIKRGRSSMIIKIGGEEIDYDSKFQLFLQSKLPNPHYRPEIAAQCTIINFIVTEEGLEDQILAMIVNVEKPELEQEKQELVRRQNDFKVTLLQLEDDLLSQLSAADPSTILDNMPLIEGLEKTKQTSADITAQVKIALKTEEQINVSRETYRPVASEGSMLFFLIIQLCIIEHMYQYSLDSFVKFLYKAIDKAEMKEDMQERCVVLTKSIRMTIFRWVNRGLFESHKLIFCSMLAFRLYALGQLPEEYNPLYFNFLMRGPIRTDIENPIIEWLPNASWFAVQKLIDLEGFEQFAHNMEKDAPNRFKEWFNELNPEEVKLPLDWKRLDQPGQIFQKLLVLRCLRPDRMAAALADWIRNTMPSGRDYMDCDGSSSFFEILSTTFEDSTNTTPIFFILSPGADPVKEVEKLGKKLIGLQANVNYHNVAMGQGQDVVAMAKLDLAHKEGHWVMLQNIHLMPKWCVELEKKMDSFAAEGSHLIFRIFLSADPNVGIPIGILERSIKLTNEPPQGLLANLRRAFAQFNKEDFEDRDAKVKAILFGLCHFHALMLERKKFGPLGYNMMYPFSTGDLRDSASVLYNYLEGSSSVKIPWDDLRYIFGAIMYGGHIVDDWDRKMCGTYLNYFMVDELLDETEMVPYSDGKLSWPSPPPGAHEKYLEHIESMPPESPLLFGMHPNAEIGFRTAQCYHLFGLLMQLQPRDKASGDDAAENVSPMAKAEGMCSDFLDEVRDINFPVEDLIRSMSDEEKGPFQFVFLQEAEYMNVLVFEMTRSLAELQLGFKGELTMSPAMESLAECLFLETIHPKWSKYGFASTRTLLSWLTNLKERCEQLNDWVAEPLTIPKVVDISKLFNPQSFLTAIMQLCCQQQSLELNKLQVFTEVTKRDAKGVDAPARDGAFVSGMFLEGARWDINANCLEESKPKEMFFRMPVVNCKAGVLSDKEEKNIYNCPTYCTPTRRPYYVFAAQLRTKQVAAKWVLGGVALILDVGIAI